MEEKAFVIASIKIRIDKEKKEAAKAKIEKIEADTKLAEANEKLAKAEKESDTVLYNKISGVGF